MNIIYTVLYYVLSLGLRIWFSALVVTGMEHIPRSGPVIFAANHPNMVLDPVLLGAVVGQMGRLDGHFWAKAPLFRGVFGWILRRVGGVPVLRREDLAADADGAALRDAHDRMFAASYDTLIAGGALFIFPEGTSSTLPHLLELRPGTARLALGLLEKHNVTCPIVPVGLNYTSKDRLQSQVLVNFGAPILPVRDAAVPLKEQALILTKELETRLEECTINADSWEDLMLLDLARQVYCSDYDVPLDQNVSITRAIQRTYSESATQPQIQTLRAQLAQYRARLDTLGLTDRYVSRLFKRRALAATLLQRVPLVLLSVLLALPGYLLHLPLHLFGSRANRLEFKETIAQAKFAMLICFVPLWYIFLWTLVYFTLGWWWLTVAVLVFPLFGYLHVTELQRGKEHARSVRHVLRVFYLALFAPDELKEINSLRSTIARTLRAEAQRKYGADAHLEKSFRLVASGELLRGDSVTALKAFTDAKVWQPSRNE